MVVQNFSLIYCTVQPYPFLGYEAVFCLLEKQSSLVVKLPRNAILTLPKFPPYPLEIGGKNLIFI